MKLTLTGLGVLLLVAPAEGQRSAAASAQQLPTYVTQLGKTHFPGGEADFDDGVTAVAALRSGAVLVAGWTWGSLGEPNGEVIPQTWPTPDIFIARFDASGSVEWIRQIGAITAPTIPALNGNPGGPGGDANGYEYAADLAVASDGSIFITGYTSSDLGETSSDVDIFLAKFDANGVLQWLRQVGAETKGAMVTPWGTPLDPSGSDFAYSLALHPSGTIYVGGDTRGDLAEPNGNRGAGIELDVFLARFSADGRLEGVRQFGKWSAPLLGFDPESDDWFPKIALHPSGSIVMACASDRYEFPLVTYDSMLLSFDTHGNPLAYQILNSAFVRDLAIARPSGRIFVAADGMGVAALDADLHVEWINHFEPSDFSHLGILGSGSPYVHGLCVDSAGDLTVAGSTSGALAEPNAGTSDIFTAKLRAFDGQIQWASQIGKATSALHGLSLKSSDGARACDLSPGGTIVVAGGTTGNFAEPVGGPGVFPFPSDVVVMRLTSRGKL